MRLAFSLNKILPKLWGAKKYDRCKDLIINRKNLFHLYPNEGFFVDN